MLLLVLLCSSKTGSYDIHVRGRGKPLTIIFGVTSQYQPVTMVAFLFRLTEAKTGKTGTNAAMFWNSHRMLSG